MTLDDYEIGDIVRLSFDYRNEENVLLVSRKDDLRILGLDRENNNNIILFNDKNSQVFFYPVEHIEALDLVYKNLQKEFVF